MRIQAPAAAAVANQADSLLHITLNQAYHKGWSSPDCGLTRGEQGNLVANCTLQAKPVDLVFFDPVSDLGMRVSLHAIRATAAALLVFALLSAIPRRRAVASPAADLP